MELEKTIGDLMTLPRRHYELGNISVLSLLKQSGYFEEFAQVSEAKILDALRSNPEYVDDWILYSEDKRTTGWYVLAGDDGVVELGYIPDKGEAARAQPVNYSDRTIACAAFIKREIEDIRRRHSNDSV